MTTITEIKRPCHGKTHIFYGKNAERPQARDRREIVAKKLCAGCPVQTECRDLARKAREIYGIWGGETERERFHAGYADIPAWMLRGARDRIAV